MHAPLHNLIDINVLKTSGRYFCTKETFFRK